VVRRPHHRRWRIEDATGRPLAYVYGDDRPQGAGSNLLTVDEARRIAHGIARLPDLMAPTEPPDQPEAAQCWVRQAPHDTTRIGAVVDQPALSNRVAPQGRRRPKG
jgi:hypothetical protein